MNLIMTLNEWEHESGRASYLYDKGVVYIHDTFNQYSEKYRTKLWQIQDYRVTSVTGGVIWLTVR